MLPLRSRNGSYGVFRYRLRPHPDISLTSLGDAELTEAL